MPEILISGRRLGGSIFETARDMQFDDDEPVSVKKRVQLKS